MTLAQKLHPSGFTAMSGRMAAILGYILGENWVEPPVAWLSVSSDGYITTESVFIGSAKDWERNKARLFDVAELTLAERLEFERLWALRVDDWRPQ